MNYLLHSLHAKQNNVDLFHKNKQSFIIPWKVNFSTISNSNKEKHYYHYHSVTPHVNMKHTEIFFLSLSRPFMVTTRQISSLVRGNQITYWLLLSVGSQTISCIHVHRTAEHRMPYAISNKVLFTKEIFFSFRIIQRYFERK